MCKLKYGAADYDSSITSDCARSMPGPGKCQTVFVISRNSCSSSTVLCCNISIENGYFTQKHNNWTNSSALPSRGCVIYFCYLYFECFTALYVRMPKWSALPHHYDIQMHFYL